MSDHPVSSVPGLSAEVSTAILDPRRLQAVAATGLLDTPADDAFDRYSRLASTVLGTPLAFVTVVDDRRSFWKSCIGVDATDLAERQNTIQQSFCQYVVSSREPLIVNDAAADPRTRDNPSVESMGVAAWAGWPVWSPDGEVLGTFCVIDTSPRSWTARDEQVLETLSQAVAGEIALRASRDEARATSEHLREVNDALTDLARTLQESLLPPHLPDAGGLDLAARYLPGRGGTQVIGDFYDVFSLGLGRWGAVIGDVCGHGLEAATTTSLARHTVRTAALSEPSPSRVLATLNDVLLARTDDDQRFLTGVYVVLSPTDHTGFRAAIARAGHPAPLIRRADGQVIPVNARGPLLGVMSDVDVPTESQHLTSGDALVLFTDGLTEQPGTAQRHWGDEALRAVVQGSGPRAAAIADAVMEGMLEHSGGEPPRDDAAVLVVGVR